MRRAAALLVAVVALAAAPAAAADVTIQAVDGTVADNHNNRWEPRGVTVRAGEVVTWSFAGTTGFHNVASTSPNWEFRNGPATVAPPTASFTFDTPGIYAFVCEVHTGTMEGTVTVTDAAGTPPPPPPPPPLSEQPWPNDRPAPSVLELVDETSPKLTGVRATAIARGARVRFRLSERARVTVRLERGGRTVKTAGRTFARGAHRFTVRDRRMRGRYRLEVRATDLAGNRSPVRRVTVRR
jgi:plastocyanin